MQEFHPRAGPQRPFVTPTEEARRFDHQEGPQPLAARQNRMPHGLHEARRPCDLLGLRFVCQKALEQPLDIRRDLGEAHRKWI
jgi:hypothetical protein